MSAARAADGPGMLVTMKPNLYTVIPGGRWSEMIFNSGITLGSITAIVLNVPGMFGALYCGETPSTLVVGSSSRSAVSRTVSAGSDEGDAGRLSGTIYSGS